jgi:competence protein ComEA
MEKTLKSVMTMCGLGLVAALALAAPASAQRRATTSTDTAEAAPVAPSGAGVVNIQTASVEQLQLLPGIGPSKAAAIVAYRETHPFHRVEDIMRVRGIGRATFRRLRPMLSVSGGTTMTTEVSVPRSRTAPATDEADDDAAE